MATRVRIFASALACYAGDTYYYRRYWFYLGIIWRIKPINGTIGLVIGTTVILKIADKTLVCINMFSSTCLLICNSKRRWYIG